MSRWFYEEIPVMVNESDTTKELIFIYVFNVEQ